MNPCELDLRFFDSEAFMTAGLDLSGGGGGDGESEV